MRRMVFFSIALTILVLALPSASADRDDRAKARRSKTVVINAAPGTTPVTWEWHEPEITIREGDTVRWKNPTSSEHTLYPLNDPDFGSEQDLPPGGSASVTFEEEGSFEYMCGVLTHSDCWYLATEECECTGMCGVINVVSRR